MKSRYRILSAALALLLLFSAFAVFAIAAENDFTTMVAGIDSSLSYAERREYADECLEVYEELGADEQAAVVSEYDELLAEVALLDALREKAETFISAVEGLADMPLIEDRAKSIELIYGDSIYFGDESYPGIAEALSTLSREDEETAATIEACRAFKNAVELATSYDESEYLQIKEALAEAAKYYDIVDNTYSGISGARASYSMLCSELQLKEEYTAQYINRVNEIVLMETYIEKYNAQARIKNYTSNSSFIEDYEGVAEAKAALAELEEYFKDCLRAATRFTLAVELAETAPGNELRMALVTGLVLVEDVDLTVPGVAAAKDSLDAMVEGYNELASVCNALMAAM